MTRLVELHRLKIGFEKQVELLRKDAEKCSSYADVRKRYEHVICKAENVLQGIEHLTAELLKLGRAQGGA
jgi:hypothetical protein